MPGSPPDGQPAPGDGDVGGAARAELAAAGGLSWYFHVPFCRTRCGYCDFNTYTAAELGEGVSRSTWADTAIDEIRFARSVLAGIDAPAPTVFFGGGTPTLLPPGDLARVLGALRDEFGIVADPEITVEANPDDVTAELLDGLLAGGVNRVSLGMQSATPATLRLLERSHRYEDMPAVADAIRASGVPRWSVDLIYGTPGESARQWEQSLEYALALQPGHISAYCLGIEEGTRLGARLRSGAIGGVDPDEAADRYEACDAILSAHGFSWYEISNWAIPDQQCRHNLAYWHGGSWWGAGPGAHSHVAGVRWWNRKHPRAWSSALASGVSPAQAREVLSDSQRHDEEILLGIRLASGLPTSVLRAGLGSLARWRDAGFAEPVDGDGTRMRLTRSGRLLADRLALEVLAGPAT